MGETYVIYPTDQYPGAPTSPSRTTMRVPFLHEILVRSLQEAGLSLADAEHLAKTVHLELENIPEIGAAELEARVSAHLQKDHGEETAQRYRDPSAFGRTVMVRDAKGRTTPFSRGRHRQYLESCGLSMEEAAAVTSKLHEHIRREGASAMDSSRLARLTYDYLQRDLGPEVARRYGVWVDFMRSDRPLLLMFMGVPGSGKSTIATEVAIRLGIVRTQSTDMLREVMRTMIPKRLAPALHTSTFKVWKVLPAYARTQMASERAVSDGFMAQAELLSIGCEAVIQRALRERVSIILEGIHVHPGLLDRLPKDTDAIVIPIMLAVLKPAALQDRFSARGEQAPDRRAERYLQHFDAIWQMQTFLLAESERWNVPIIPNNDMDKTLREVMAVIIDALARDFVADPGRSFMASPAE